jgi:hypothetical protein
MKKLVALLCFVFLATLSARAVVLFQDDLNYPNGLIETDGLWQVYSPIPPVGDAFVTNDLLILNQNNSDEVDAPFTNNTGSTVVFASFTINVTTLPTTAGGYFCEFQDASNVDNVAHVFIATTGTSVPGTYRLGINNFSEHSGLTTSLAVYYPLDLATNTTYYVVFSYDTNVNATYPNATLVVNPASIADYESSTAYGTDNTLATPGQASIDISALGFSQYVNQGVAGIGDVIVGTTFGDVFPYTPTNPVVGIQPQPTNVYSGNPVTLYTAASGLGQLTYQWLSNGVALTDNGTTTGSLSNILSLSSLQNTAGYSVIVTGVGGSVTSMVATITVNGTLTAPFFTTQPVSATNSLGASITLTAAANGTGPLTYAWYFEETNTSTFTQVASGPTLTLPGLNFAQSGQYYVLATGGDGSTTSSIVNVQVIPPPLVTIAYLHSLMSTNNSSTTINNGAIYTVRGIVTTIGNIESRTASEYFIQDATGGSFVYIGSGSFSNTPPAGALVQITGPAQSYYGELELDPSSSNSTNSITVISTNNPLPAPQPLNLPLMATNTLGAYGVAIECSLVTLTNVYLYSSATGAAVTGTWPSNSTKALYAFNQPYTVGAPHMEIYVYTYTNTSNSLNTNYWYQPIPSFAYEITGAMGVYNPTTPEVYPSRYQDFVTTLPPAPTNSISTSNGVTTISWTPSAVGSTYSVYNSPNVNGPYSRTFGLSYYPSSGIYTVTNTSTNQFFYVTSP